MADKRSRRYAQVGVTRRARADRRPALKTAHPSLDFRDELAIVRDYVGCAYFACASSINSSVPSRSAVCTVLNDARERLDELLLEVDRNLKSS